MECVAIRAQAPLYVIVRVGAAGKHICSRRKYLQSSKRDLYCVSDVHQWSIFRAWNATHVAFRALSEDCTGLRASCLQTTMRLPHLTFPHLPSLPRSCHTDHNDAAMFTPQPAILHSTLSHFHPSPPHHCSRITSHALYLQHTNIIIPATFLLSNCLNPSPCISLSRHSVFSLAPPLLRRRAMQQLSHRVLCPRSLCLQR